MEELQETIALGKGGRHALCVNAGHAFSELTKQSLIARKFQSLTSIPCLWASDQSRLASSSSASVTTYLLKASKPRR